MIKTKEDLLKELEQTQEKMKDFPQNLYKRNLIKALLSDNIYSLHLIQQNCIKNKCPNHDIINFKGYNLNVCYDDWSDTKIGWHVIYTETLDLCFKNKTKDNTK